MDCDCVSENEPLLKNDSFSKQRRYSDDHKRHFKTTDQTCRDDDKQQQRQRQHRRRSHSFTSEQRDSSTAPSTPDVRTTSTCSWTPNHTVCDLGREEKEEKASFATTTAGTISNARTTRSTDRTRNWGTSADLDRTSEIASTLNVCTTPNVMKNSTISGAGTSTDMDQTSNTAASYGDTTPSTAASYGDTTPNTETSYGDITANTETSYGDTTANTETSYENKAPNAKTSYKSGTGFNPETSPNTSTSPNSRSSPDSETATPNPETYHKARTMEPDSSASAKTVHDGSLTGGSSSSSSPPPDIGAGDGKKRMALLTLVTFLVTCAGKIHSPLLTQYTYQVYTDLVYGNESHGVHVSKHPCLNDTSAADSNSSGSAASLSVGKVDPRMNEVQDRSADLLMRLDMVSGGIAIVVCLLLGTYSDVLGRRFLLLVTLLGHFLRNASAPVIIYWDLGLAALYAGYVVDGLCGGAAGILLGLYVYAADITKSDQQRTLGMVLVETGIGLSKALTNLGAGYFIEDTGFFYPSLASSLLLLVSFLVVIFWLPETVSRDRKRCMSPVEGVRRVGSVFMFVDEPRQRPLLLLGLLAFFLTLMPDISDSKLRTLYVMERPFCWSSIQIGLLLCFKDGGSRLASLVIVQCLRTHVQTPLLGVLGALSLLGGDVLMGLASNDLMVYLAPVVGMAGALLIPSIVAMMSRRVSSGQQGALFAGVAVVESSCYCLSQLCFLSLFRASVSLLAGLVYLVIAGCHLLVILCLLIYLCLLPRVPPSDQVKGINIQSEDSPVS